jgi:probable addiction module antidote protein
MTGLCTGLFVKTTYATFDIAEYLDNDEVIAAIGDVAKAKGMASIAKTAGLGRESLYKALRKGARPRFDTINAVLHAIGAKFTVTSADPS